jgi:adenosylhomocysteine nucleosidase
MRVEVRPLIRSLSLRSTQIGDMPVHSGVLGAQDVIAVTTGIGPEAATRTTERLLRLADIDHVVVVGVAGGVEDGICIGDVVIPEVVVMASTGAEYRPVRLGKVPLRGRLLTSGQLSTGPEVMARLRAQQVTAVDMETAAIAAVCARENVRWSAFRAISDRLVDNIVKDSFTGMANSDGTPRLGAILRYLLRHPGAIRGLLRLSGDTRVAVAAAAAAAIRACA